MNTDNIVIFSSRRSSYLARRIAEGLGLRGISRLRRRNFPDGERYYRIQLNERTELMGKDAIFVASTHNDKDFLELARVGGALTSYGARRRIFVIPFYGYSTMERAVYPGEVVTAKENARILSAIPNTGMGNIFLMLDLHLQGMENYFEGDCLRFELHTRDVLIEKLRQSQDWGLHNFMFASADLGRPLWVQAFAKTFATDIALIDQRRDEEGKKIVAVVGNVEGKTVVMYDDMTRSGGTIIRAAEAYIKRGAVSVYAVLSHCALNSGQVVKTLEDSPIEKILITNSHPMSQHPAVLGSQKFVTVDISPIFISAIKRILEP